MKKETVTLLLCGMAALTVLGLIAAITKVDHNKKAEKQDLDLDEDFEDENYITYVADFGDGYKLYFDYVDGFTELKGLELGGMVSKEYSLGMSFITATHVPAMFNNKGIPRTAEEYIDTKSDAEFWDALPYVNGDTKGYAYWEESQTGGYNHGYQLFDGDEYFYIFVHSSGTWPANIKNVRIVRE